MPDVPDTIWQRFEAVIRRDFGTTRPYIAAHRKRQNLQQLETLIAAGNEETDAQLARRLGVSERRVRQYKQLQKA